MGVRDTPLMVALRFVEWDYGRDGWHGTEDVDPALYALHYRTVKRHSIESVRLPVAASTWRAGPVIVLSALRVVIERRNTAVCHPGRPSVVRPRPRVRVLGHRLA